MWARIENQKVVELIDFDPFNPRPRFHESLVWVPCQDGTEECDLYDGATFSKPPPPPPPVLTCTPWQIRKALNQTGLRSVVESAVAAADQTTRDGWEFATEFRRDDPLLSSMGAALGKTEAEIDALFALARSL